MWFATPYGYAYAPARSGLRAVYVARGYQQVPDSDVVGLQDAPPAGDGSPTADELAELARLINDEVPERERG